MQLKGYGSAPGKIILSGEHSVVYGYPALAIAINLRCEVETELNGDELVIESNELNEKFVYSPEDCNNVFEGKPKTKVDNIAFAALSTLKLVQDSSLLNIHIKSQIPISAGLGSSAAVVVATIASIADLFQKQIPLAEISDLAFEAEKITHGKPSGIDNSIATHGGLIHFENGNIENKVITNHIPIIIGNSQIARDTKILVAGVAELRRANPDIINPVIKTMGKLTLELEEAVLSIDIDKIGELFDINQGLLDSIGVGHSKLSQMIWMARKFGAIGAKLTGAGGGGCMIAITKTDEEASDVASKMEASGLSIISTQMSKTGVKQGRG
ncbi:MAG: mevalonate kinase [Candidatus Heimdallarchaeota archaeon]|nr:mevalonate kinase [Candidatus Heimdallarchaeota archaeon]